MERIIINHSHSKNFTIIPNEILQATDIPFFTKGVLCYLLSLPSNWKVSVSHLASHFGESEYKMTRALKDLISLGYCQRIDAHGEHGRFNGQIYKITDIRWDFSEPTVLKSDGVAPATEYPKSADPVIFADTVESTDTAKNEGSIKNKEDINNKNIYKNKQEEKKRGVNALNPHDEPLCLFSDSRFADFEKFATEFAGDDFAGVDIRYYYEVLSNWSASKRAKKNDWIATAKNWMMRDYKEGRLVRTQQNNPGGMQDWQYEAIMRDRAMDDDSLWRQD
jgi:hypothetical protein